LLDLVFIGCRRWHLLRSWLLLRAVTVGHPTTAVCSYSCKDVAHSNGSMLPSRA